MEKLTRKQREIRERETLIKQTAREIIDNEGFHLLSMDKIAVKIEYSKGTVYQHFNCKEEIIAAICIDTSNELLELFKKAAAFKGSTREKMAAVLFCYLLSASIHPTIFDNLQIVRSAAVQEKLSQQRLNKIIQNDSKMFSVVVNIVELAIKNKEVMLPNHFSPYELVFGLWSTTHGAVILQNTNTNWAELGIADPYMSVLSTTQAILDGLNWQPHSSKMDTEAIFEKLKNEVFSDEYALASSSNCCTAKGKIIDGK